MTTESAIDQVLDGWFIEGPTNLPDRAIAAVVQQLDDVPQRRPIGQLGNINVARFLYRLRFVAVVVALLAVAVVAVPSLPRRAAPPAASLPTSAADWSQITIDSVLRAESITRVAAGARGLVAVARSDDGSSRILFSPDGRDWSLAEVPATGEYVSVVATDRGFLMSSSEEGAWTSENGLEWQQVADNWSGNPDEGGAIVLDAVAGGPGYVAVGNHNAAWYSADGSDWAPAVVPSPPDDLIRPDYPDLTVDILHVAAAGNNLVATGYYVAENSNGTGAGRDFVLASGDGRTWSTVLPEVGDRAGPLEVAAEPTGFLVIGGPLDGEDASTIWHSADGQTWQNLGWYDFRAGSAQNAVRIEAVAATESGYVAVGLENDCDSCAYRPALWTSPDGRSWSALAGIDSSSLSGGETTLAFVAPYGSRFVVGGQRGGQPAVWISGSDDPQ